MKSTMIEKALPGLHDEAARRIATFATAGRRLLDLGAGSGAWASRLRGQGWDVTALDREDSAFRAEGIRFFSVDLNRDFGVFLGSDRFDVITAVEVIEHLENPRHLLRVCRELLAAGGRILLTTPNIECSAGRLRFLVHGKFRMFDDDPRFNDLTHITPINLSLFHRMVRETGFEIEFHGFNRPEPTITRPAFRLACAIVKPLMRGPLGGDNHIFVLRASR